jgi:hypothetical protein
MTKSLYKPCATRESLKLSSSSLDSLIKYHLYHYNLPATYHLSEPSELSTRCLLLRLFRISPPAPQAGMSDSSWLLCETDSSIQVRIPISFLAHFQHPNVPAEKRRKRAALVSTSFAAHRPVWITAGGAGYTSAVAVFLAMKYMRRLPV